MHFAVRGYLFIVLTALLGVAGTWSDEPAFATAWLFPAFVLLAGLALEAAYQRNTRLAVHMHVESALKLGKPAAGAFAFEHNRGRELRIQYARVLPVAIRQSDEVREIGLPPDGELRDSITLLPLRLGPGQFADVPARVLGRFSLAWWSRSLTQDQPFVVAPDSLPRGARPIAGESAGETPRRLPGAGVELLQLRDYSSGDALSRIDWKATARRGALVSREYSEAQHLEILIVVDASRASRVRAGDLDRLGLYANVAARLAEHAVSVEDRVGLLVYAERTLGACLPDRGMRAVTRLRRTLERLDTGRGEPDPVAAAIQVRRMLRHRGLVVWLTDLAEPARNAQLMQALKALVPRHMPVVAAPHAAEIARLAEAPAVEWRDPGVAIAAREHRRRAQQQVAELRHQGVVVLDEPDDALDRAVFEAYLQLRRRRRV
jgi:uncharacterized protein (DUF58 family)